MKNSLELLAFEADYLFSLFSTFLLKPIVKLQGFLMGGAIDKASQLRNIIGIAISMAPLIENP